jgi:CRISPR-associated protein Csd2
MDNTPRLKYIAHFKVHVKDGVEDPRSIDDYEIKLQELDGLKPEIIEGE